MNNVKDIEVLEQQSVSATEEIITSSAGSISSTDLNIVVITVASILALIAGALYILK